MDFFFYNLRIKECQLKSKVDAKSISSNTYEPEEDISGIINRIIEQLLSSLRDMDKMVRWPAAKGIAQITRAASLELFSSNVSVVQETILMFLLDLFNKNLEDEFAWHGGCLCLAELAACLGLGAHELLLTNASYLSKFVSILLDALVFDKKQGSQGNSVRDSASNVCRTFAQFFTSETLSPFTHQIVTRLLAVVLFDREINCRRSAMAAFKGRFKQK